MLLFFDFPVGGLVLEWVSVHFLSSNRFHLQRCLPDSFALVVSVKLFLQMYVCIYVWCVRIRVSTCVCVVEGV